MYQKITIKSCIHSSLYDLAHSFLETNVWVFVTKEAPGKNKRLVALIDLETFNYVNGSKWHLFDDTWMTILATSVDYIIAD